MKWYKRDPDAALSGMAELSFEECGAYNRLIDLLYSRDLNVPDDDAFCAMVFHCRPQTWRRLKKALMAKGKVRETDGKLTANRVETTFKEAANFSLQQQSSAKKRWKSTNGHMPRGNPSTTTTTSILPSLTSSSSGTGNGKLQISESLLEYEKQRRPWR